MAFISKEENFHVPFFGRIMRKCCFLPIDREKPAEAIKTVYQAVDLLNNDEVSMGVYPEGTRNTTDDLLLPFHDGVFMIARKANVPIVVVTAHNTRDIQHNFPRKGSCPELHFLSCIPSETVKTTSNKDLGMMIREMMEKDLKK